MNTCLYYLLSIAYFNHMLYIHFNIFFSPHSPLDGVNHLIRFYIHPNHLPSLYASSLPSTDIYVQPWILTVIPENLKQMVDRRYLCFLRSLVKSLLLHLLTRLWFTAAGCPHFWQWIILFHTRGLGSWLTNRKKEHGWAGFEPSTSELVSNY